MIYLYVNKGQGRARSRPCRASLAYFHTIHFLPCVFSARWPNFHEFLEQFVFPTKPSSYLLSSLSVKCVRQIQNSSQNLQNFFVLIIAIFTEKNVSQFFLPGAKMDQSFFFLCLFLNKHFLANTLCFEIS